MILITAAERCGLDRYFNDIVEKLNEPFAARTNEVLSSAAVGAGEESRFYKKKISRSGVGERGQLCGSRPGGLNKCQHFVNFSVASRSRHIGSDTGSGPGGKFTSTIKP